MTIYYKFGNKFNFAFVIPCCWIWWAHYNNITKFCDNIEIKLEAMASMVLEIIKINNESV